MNNDAMDIGSIKAQVMEDFYKNSEKRLLEQQERIKSLENELKVYAAVREERAWCDCRMK